MMPRIELVAPLELYLIGATPKPAKFQIEVRPMERPEEPFRFDIPPHQFVSWTEFERIRGPWLPLLSTLQMVAIPLDAAKQA